MAENGKNKNKKLTEKQQKIDKYGFSNHDYDIINNEILEIFDNGEFKYDKSAKCQTESYRNHKRSSKKFILENMTINGHKYFRSMLRSILTLSKKKDSVGSECNTECNDNSNDNSNEISEKDSEISELNDEISQLTITIQELTKLKYNCEQFHSKENITALANSMVQEMNEQFKNDYVCNREDVKELNKTITRKTEDVNYYKEKVSELEKDLEYQREKAKDSVVESSENANSIAKTLVGVETQSFRSTIKELKEELKESQTKLKSKDKEIEKLNQNSDSISTGEKTKYLKKIKSLTIRIMELELEVDAM